MNLSVEPRVGTNPGLWEPLLSAVDAESHGGTHEPWLVNMPVGAMPYRAPVVTPMGTAASSAVWVDPRLLIPASASSNLVRLEDQPREEMVWQMSLPEERWMQVKWKHFRRDGREARIEAALAALEQAVVHYELDDDTVRWIAEGADAEDM